MNECYPSLFSLGDPAITWVAQHLRHSWLTHFMVYFSFLGKSAVAAVLGILCFLGWRKREGSVICSAIFISIILNMIIKEWIKECRPPQQFWLEQVSGFAFPSGHAEVGPLLWWGLAYYVRPLWLKTTFILIGLLIGLSRIYLGVHYPQDVFVGFLLGLIVLSLCILVEKKFINSFCGQPV